jgi:hypothetical protein
MFYGYLQRLPNDRQVIVVENTDPPVSIIAHKQSLKFTKNPHQGRYGLFPPFAGDAPQASAPNLS